MRYAALSERKNDERKHKGRKGDETNTARGEGERRSVLKFTIEKAPRLFPRKTHTEDTQETKTKKGQRKGIYTSIRGS